MINECDCKLCQGACTVRPGWFKPGEAEKAAKLLNMTLQEFFDKFCAVDYMEKDENIYLIAPALVGENTGNMYPADPRGECIFYKDGKCKIHHAKPFECANYHHDMTRDEIEESHTETYEALQFRQAIS